MAPRGAAGFITFDIVGDEHGVQHMLDRLDSALSPTGLALFLTGAVDPYVRKRATERFRSEGDDVSGKWAPLAERTQEIRSSGEWPVSGAHPINKRTGELEAYITQSDSRVIMSGMGSTLQYPTPSGKKSLREKMKTAQTGRTSPRTPPRPVLGLNEQDLTSVLMMLGLHVKGLRR